MVAHISRIRIVNYRSFAEFEIGPLPPAVVVIGENRSGKSNLVRALRLVLDPMLPDSQRYLQAEDFWDGARNPMTGDIVEVVVQLGGFDDDDVAIAALAEALISEDPLVAQLGYRYRPREDLGGEQRTGRAGYEFVTWQGGDESRRITSEVRRWVALQVLPALRDAEGDLQSWRRSPLRPLVERIDLGTAELAELQQKVDEVRAELADEPSVRTLNQSIIHRLRAMVGEHFAVETDLSIAASRSDQLLRAIRLFAESPIARRMADTSLGTSNLIYLALLLEQAQMRLDDQDLATSILAVEEPEAHLHPQVQRVLFRYLLSGDTPMFVTTHSPHIASVTPLPSIVLLKSAAGTTTPGTTAGANLTEAEILDLQRYLDVTRAEMLFSRGTVFVEGAAELFIVPAIASLMGIDLEALGITVSAVHGTDFVSYVRLLGPHSLAVPNIVITDGDLRDGVRTGLTRARRIVAATSEAAGTDLVDETAEARFRDEGVFVGQRTLELDLIQAYPEPFASALASLVPGAQARARSEADVHSALSGDLEAEVRVLARIERIGKGRFAQRLAPFIDHPAGPDYIAEAVNSLARQLGHDA